MKETRSNMQLTTKLLFRLLPVQFFLALISYVNAVISGLFASNYVSVDALSAIGLYNPINMFLNAVSIMLVGGSTIICGKYMGRGEEKKVQNVFSLDCLLSIIIASFFVVLFFVSGSFDLTGVIAKDPVVRPLFNRYLLGQAVGMIPMLLGNQLASFLSLENRMRRTTFASIVYIASSFVFNYVFVVKMQLGTFGLALASSFGLWIFMLVQAQYYLTSKTSLRFFNKNLDWKETLQIIKVGVPGAATFGYQTLRGFIVNELMVAYIGSVAVSAFTASDTLLRIGWALPTGMVAVSRMLMSISIGEEDRQTLVDVMRNMFYRFIPFMCAIIAVVMICAKPLTMLYYTDTSDPVFMMTVWGFRILPLSMPLSIISMHFVCYGQASNKQFLVHLLSILDGVVCVAGFTALLIPTIGMNSVYIANVLNGIVTTIVIWAYPIIVRKKFPKSVDELMVIPDGFGVSEDNRMDLSVKNIDEVVTIAESVQKFCEDKGIDKRRAYLSGLFLEEMAGNVVMHGFNKDKKKHSVDIRVVKKDDSVILRIKDDCVEFDPRDRAKNPDPEDITKNIGIQMVYKETDRIEYQNLLGLNVLTITI